MCIKLRLSPSLYYEAGSQLEYVLIGQTIGECLRNTKKLSPEINKKIWKKGHLCPQIILFHNNTIIKENSFSNLVKDMDVLDIIPAIEGG